MSTRRRAEVQLLPEAEVAAALGEAVRAVLSRHQGARQSAGFQLADAARPAPSGDRIARGARAVG